jgi:hypothetical protein
VGHGRRRRAGDPPGCQWPARLLAARRRRRRLATSGAAAAAVGGWSTTSRPPGAAPRPPVSRCGRGRDRMAVPPTRWRGGADHRAQGDLGGRLHVHLGVPRELEHELAVRALADRQERALIGDMALGDLTTEPSDVDGARPVRRLAWSPGATRPASTRSSTSWVVVQRPGRLQHEHPVIGWSEPVQRAELPTLSIPAFGRVSDRKISPSSRRRAMQQVTVTPRPRGA